MVKSQRSKKVKVFFRDRSRAATDAERGTHRKTAAKTSAKHLLFFGFYAIILIEFVNNCIRRIETCKSNLCSIGS